MYCTRCTVVVYNRNGTKDRHPEMVDLNLYKVGEVESVEDNKNLKVCQVNLGGDETLTVVTKASNVRQGSR